MANQRQRDEHVHAEAAKMAESGDYASWWGIEQALVRRGFTKAQSLLDSPSYRASLDATCKAAQEKRAEAKRRVNP